MPSVQLPSALTPSVIEMLCQRLLTALPKLLAIYAFGSQVQGNAHAESDLDLAVLVAGYADPLQLWQLAGEFSEIVRMPVDLLDMRGASTVMQYQILTTSQRWWARELEAGLFECYVLSEKTALDEARAPLLADIQERGTIYGHS